MNRNDKQPVSLGAVQETLLIPLLGRARETQKPGGLVSDPRAVEIVERLDYDFGKWEGTPSLLGACVRTMMFDGFVREFLETHPQATVVEIGCGLNTRFERVDNGSVRWFDVDLPDVIELRRRFFEDTPRRTMIDRSVLDENWMTPVLDAGGPWMFISEAVLIYLDEPDVRRAVERIATSFPGAWIAMDSADAAFVRSQDKHDAMRHLSTDSWARWECDDPKVVETWSPGLRLERSLSFLDAEEDLVDKMPLLYRLLVRFAPAFLTKRIRGYRLNLYRTGPASPPE